MSGEVNAAVLSNVLNEYGKVCPDTYHIFLLSANDKVLASDQNTTSEDAERVAHGFATLKRYARFMGEVEMLRLDGDKRWLSIARVEDCYVANVVQPGADEKKLNALTRVLIPAALKLARLMDAQLTEKAEGQAQKPPSEEVDESSQKQSEEVSDLSPARVELPEYQFMVEPVRGIRGLIGLSDTVYVDSATVTRWNSLYAEKKAAWVIVKTLKGKAVRCRYKPMRNPAVDGKGLINIPEKILTVLDAKKGDLVTVKPVIE
jgi:hypothetical protein